MSSACACSSSTTSKPMFEHPSQWVFFQDELDDFNKIVHSNASTWSRGKCVCGFELIFPDDFPYQHNLRFMLACPSCFISFTPKQFKSKTSASTLRCARIGCEQPLMFSPFDVSPFYANCEASKFTYQHVKCGHCGETNFSPAPAATPRLDARTAVKKIDLECKTPDKVERRAYDVQTRLYERMREYKPTAEATEEDLKECFEMVKKWGDDPVLFAQWIVNQKQHQQERQQAQQLQQILEQQQLADFYKAHPPFVLGQHPKQS